MTAVSVGNVPLSDIEAKIFDYIACSNELVRDPGSGRNVAYYDRIVEKFSISRERASLSVNKLIDLGVVEMVPAPNDLPYVSFFMTELGSGYRRRAASSR